MDAKTIVETCKGKELFGLINFSILNDSSPLPPKKPIAPLRSIDLFPPTPTIHPKNRRDLSTPRFEEFCVSYPIVVIRNTVPMVDIDLRIFWSWILAKRDPAYQIKTYKQIKQHSSVENWHAVHERKDWHCYNYCDLRYRTIAQYWHYQYKHSARFYDDMTYNMMRNRRRGSLDLRAYEERREIYMCTDVYFTDKEKWEPQLKELSKLPAFLQTGTSNDMLGYVGREIPGMNTVHLRMMVPGCRITGRQESSNFCAVSINIYGDDCEWFAVSNEYWGAIMSLCERNDVDYLRDSWWPSDLMELIKENIPVYNFRQREGDLVWINTGCIYWVQSSGCCNVVTWNVGPLVARQYQAAIERYELYKLRSIRPTVPMIRLSWNLARDVPVADSRLFELIKTTLLMTMKQCCLLLEHVKERNVTVRLDKNHVHKLDDYCDECNIELFNILFIPNAEVGAYCLYCTLRKSSTLEGFDCLQEYDMRDLMNVYDKFILRSSVPSPASTTSSLSSIDA